VTTAFVSHHDIARHDTGWSHPDHQGRIPALVRAVYRDTPATHGHLLQVEAVPATGDDLLLVHTPEYLRSVREAVARAAAGGRPVPFAGEVVVSDASWDAAVASVGAALTGVETVGRGEARNAFCSARPPGRDAAADRSGGHSILNAVAVAARHLRERRGVGRVLVVDWGARAPLGTPAVLGGDPGVRTVSVHQHPAPSLAEPTETFPTNYHAFPVPAGAGGAEFGAALAAALEGAAAWEPQWILLSAGFDVLAGDPLGGLAVRPREVYDLTLLLRGAADRCCGGRLVSVLEGGYDPAATGQAVVQHLRALAGLPPA
jgi:acetoin utilization deacetylase AcuC-like enzyme